MQGEKKFGRQIKRGICQWGCLSTGSVCLCAEAAQSSVGMDECCEQPGSGLCFSCPECCTERGNFNPTKMLYVLPPNRPMGCSCTPATTVLFPCPVEQTAVEYSLRNRLQCQNTAHPPCSLISMPGTHNSVLPLTLELSSPWTLSASSSSTKLAQI